MQFLAKIVKPIPDEEICAEFHAIDEENFSDLETQVIVREDQWMADSHLDSQGAFVESSYKKCIIFPWKVFLNYPGTYFSNLRPFSVGFPFDYNAFKATYQIEEIDVFPNNTIIIRDITNCEGLRYPEISWGGEQIGYALTPSPWYMRYNLYLKNIMSERTESTFVIIDIYEGEPPEMNSPIAEKMAEMTQKLDDYYKVFDLNKRYKYNFEDIEPKLIRSENTRIGDSKKVRNLSTVTIQPGMSSSKYLNSKMLNSSDDLIKSKKFSLFPNPSTGLISIYTREGKGGGLIEGVNIINLEGKIVYTFLSNDSSEFNISNGSKMELDLTFLPSGLYIVEIIKGEVVFFEKLILQTKFD